MKKGPNIPGWSAGAVIALVVVAVLFFVLKNVQGEGPRDPSTYPKEAFSPPAYDANKYGGYTQNGQPVGQKP